MASRILLPVKHRTAFMFSLGREVSGFDVRMRASDIFAFHEENVRA